ATRVPGALVVADAIGLGEQVAAADLVVTGEGGFDATSLRGKVVAAVAAAAGEQGRPCLVVAGQVVVGRREAAAIGVHESWSLAEQVGLAAALAEPAASLAAVAARVARRWSP
ncbi:MAG: glycerate kinase, partial [Mycobacteriales bacterium]